MAPNIIIRQLGPIVSAVRNLQQLLYQSPRTTIDSITDGMWPNPLQPITPMGPAGAQPIGWPLQWGRNLNYTPRGDAEYSAPQLRQLARYVVARLCVENNKDVLTRIPFKIQLKPKPGENTKARSERAKNDETLLKLNRFFARPNPQETWSEFIRPVIDDMLVIDAASIFVGREASGKISELRWVEGASITRLVDQHGWTPPAPNPAYQQLYEGYPRLDFTTDQLVYRPRNIVPRGTQSSYLYGMSPTEQVAQEIEIGIARLQFILDFYTEGTIPGGMIFAPLGTPVDKIKEAQQFIDSDLAGQLAKRRRIQIFQGFQQEGKSEQILFPKEPELTDTFDELHVRKIAFGYGVSPTRLMRQMNRSSGQQQQESAEKEGTLPWLDWLKGTMDYIIQVLMKQPDYELAFDPFQELDALKRAMADEQDVKSGLYTRNEKRVERGDEPRPEPEADQLMVASPGIVPLGYIPPKPSGPSTTGTRAPAGGAQPKASRQAQTTASATKTNGHTTWMGCDAHKDSYPRMACRGCVMAEIDRAEKLQHQSQEIEVY